MDHSTLLEKILNKKDISKLEASMLLQSIIDGEVSKLKIAAFLTTLRMKGETSDEIVGFIETMRKNMLHVAIKGTIDVCGTGGDKSRTFNISTAVALVVAGAGVRVVKHGNRAASSLSGSADVLEALGVHISCTPEQAEQILKRVGMVFLFAPLFHPAMKEVVSIRKELKVRTVFNLLGPFVNPASVKRQLIGVPNLAIAKTLATTATHLGYSQLFIVTSSDGLDEASISSKSTVFVVQGDKVTQFILDPMKFGLQKASKQALTGGDALKNAEIINDILDGVNGPKRDVVVLNSALALFASGAAKGISHGISLAVRSIDTGAAKTVLEKLRKETKTYAT